MMPVLLDVESKSRADLKDVGGRNYWEDPTSEVLCVVLYDTDRQTLDVWAPGMPCPLRPDAVLAAHNAMGFDRFAIARLGWRPIYDRWIDTSELARRSGLPGALDALGARWLGLRKDKAASEYTKRLSSVKRPSGKGPEAIPADVWKRMPKAEKRRAGVQPPVDSGKVVRYCVSDVEIMAYGWPQLEPWLDMGWEDDVLRADRALNDRGIVFDRQLAKRLLEEDARNSEAVIAAVARELHWTAEQVREAAGSPEQFCEQTGAPNAQKQTVAGIDHPLVRARQALASIARGKLTKGLLRTSPDGRMRDTQRYYGAHTGRWSGKGMQLQNMPRPDKQFETWGDDEICRLADQVLAGRHATPEEIDLLLRATLTAKPGHVLAVCDFTGVEARGLSWCANDRGALATIASGRDPYRIAAAVIFDATYDDIPKTDERRQAGKVAELACGYGGAAGALTKMATQMGIDLSASGKEPSEIVRAWRKLHAPVVRFWAQIESAFASAVQGKPARVDCFDFVPSSDGKDVAIFLPSGRPIVYNNTRISRDHRGRPQLSYEGPKDARDKDASGNRVGDPKPMREKLYGGLLTENVIQAMCRDLMADALVRCEAGGLDPVLTIHDEIVCEVPASAGKEAYEYLKHEMTALPAWAEGFPIAAAGHVGKRGRK